MHPIWAIHGKIDYKLFREMCSDNVIIDLDRNVFQYLLSAVKRGSFDGDWRKELTAFLTWTIINNYSVAPFTAIKEQAYFKNGNMSGNKELDLFNYLYDDVTVPTIINSFFSEGIKFVGKSFGDAANDERVSFVKESADYYFLYAAVLY